MPPARAALFALSALYLTGCKADSACEGPRCTTLVFAAIGQPVALLPPVTDEILDRDIHDQMFLKLADIGESGNTVGDEGFEKQLADGWNWPDSLTLSFHLDPRARWHDGRPVTARDVAFTWSVYADSVVDSPWRQSLERITSVTATDSGTVVFRFDRRYSEMFYDAVYHMRVLPHHLLDTVPRAAWRNAAFARAPVGNGPYRFASWTQAQSLELTADTAFFLGAPAVRRLIWRFNADPQAALTQLIAGEADAIEVLVGPPNVQRAREAPDLTLYPYPGNVYTLLGFNLHPRRARRGPHPVLGDAAVRRALVLATDRGAMARSVFGGNAQVPPAPIPQAWTTLWFDDLEVPPYDTLRADSLLDAAGWRDSDGDGVRDRGGRKLSFAILVPSTSASRQQYARLIQEQLRLAGVEVTIEETDMPTLQQRLRAGDFDAAIQSWANDPSPLSGVPNMWTRGGGTNLGGYDNPAFETELLRVRAASSAAEAGEAWKTAFRILAEDAPAIVLAAPDNIAAVHRRFTGVKIRSDSYWALVRTWRPE